MSFVANGNSAKSNIQVRSGAFFPAISLDDVRAEVRIDGAVTDIRLRQVIREEIIDVNRLLAGLTDQADTLADLAKDTIDDQPDTVILYFSAVANGVAAKIAERYSGYDSTNSGADKAEQLRLTIDEYRRNKHWAIKQLLGENHTVVDLI